MELTNELIKLKSKAFNDYKKNGGYKSFVMWSDTDFRKVIKEFYNKIYNLNNDFSKDL